MPRLRTRTSPAERLQDPARGSRVAVTCVVTAPSATAVHIFELDVTTGRVSYSAPDIPEHARQWADVGEVDPSPGDRGRRLARFARGHVARSLNTGTA